MDPSAPPGHILLAERLAALPRLLEDYLAEPFPQLPWVGEAPGRVVATGTGSSEAHARFLVSLLNHHTSWAAEYRPLSAFLGPPAPEDAKTILVVVSQGISPNAHVALERRHAFRGLALFTATTPAGAMRAGKTDRGALLRSLEAEGAIRVPFPLEEEYTTLIRFIGPLAGYLAALRFAGALGGRDLPDLNPASLRPLLAARPPSGLADLLHRKTNDFRRGFYFVTGAPLVDYGHNIGFKFLEGLFWSCPGFWDFLQFAHGPFQEVTLQPRPVIILQTPGAAEAELADRTRRMLEGADLEHATVTAAAAPPLAVLEFEACFNALVIDLIRRLDINQVAWPSKGRDDPLYGFYRLG
ncbi:MAG: creatininase [Puniceicoccaceae bacterium]|nr:MAG: creatininase [Puniceicoccaceae bacterium]